MAAQKPDNELILLYKKRSDLDLIGELYKRYTSLVYGVCVNYLKDRDEAKEIIRLVKEGPAWTPSMENGKPVESTARVQLKFDPAKGRRQLVFQTLTLLDSLPTSRTLLPNHYKSSPVIGVFVF